MDDENILLGKTWHLCRKSKGLTQEYVSEKLELGPRYISDLERDKTVGSLRTLIKLCNLYQVTPTIVLQDYLEIKDDYKIDLDLIGFYSLDNRDKDIILKMIEYMNTKKKIKNFFLYFFCYYYKVSIISYNNNTYLYIVNFHPKFLLYNYQ